MMRSTPWGDFGEDGDDGRFCNCQPSAPDPECVHSIHISAIRAAALRLAELMIGACGTLSIDSTTASVTVIAVEKIRDAVRTGSQERIGWLVEQGMDRLFVDAADGVAREGNVLTARDFSMSRHGPSLTVYVARESGE